MDIQKALTEIKKFWNSKDILPFGESNNNKHLDRLQGEFELKLPAELTTYIAKYAPLKDFSFTTVGNPMDIYRIDRLKFLQDGYNYNSLIKEKIEAWSNSYFIIADEGADPVIIDLKFPENGITKLTHGQGDWKSGEAVADSIGQFLLCSAALHHALCNICEEPVIDDARGFNLDDSAAKWLFPKMKVWAGDYYETWCSVFDNY